ncbi:twin transmembrane helix small protein [Candidatus Methylocalor cossyra]|uniref:Twin transmembrane helix small protein n=1 Tax=Candidatus Methylocalor cossyra TaxID=3108543 RepID=A0ABM9NK74_9GAMM
MRIVVILFLLVILASLGSGLYYLLKDRNRSPRTVKALTLRISLSVLLFFLLLLAYRAGWLQPHGLRSGLLARPPAPTAPR